MRNGLGTAGFVLGLVGLVLSFIPIIGVIAWPLVIVGLVLAILGFNRARKGQADNRGLALAGIILSILGLIMCVLYAAVFTAAVATSPATIPGGLPAAAPTGDRAPHAFGEVANVGETSFSVSTPAKFTPSSSALVPGPNTRAVKVNVTLTNNGSAPYAFNPFSLSPTATAGGAPAPQVFDSARDVGPPGASTILPGKSITYPVAFAVPTAPGDFQVELSSSLFGAPVVFAGTA